MKRKEESGGSGYIVDLGNMLAEMVKSDERWWRRNRTAMVVLWVAASVVLCVGIQWHFTRSGMRKAEETLESMCEERARMLQDQFAVSVNHVHALAILVSTFHYQKDPPALDQETFADYTERTSFERPLLNGVAYAQRVVHAHRELFEKRQGWTIKTMTREPSPVQDEYAPVIYSQETISYIEALDMMSGEEDCENILRARASGKAVLTRPFRLLGSNHLGVVLTFPVYISDLPADATVEERVKATAGYLGGAFDVESLVENLLRQLAGNQDILVHVYDVTNASEPLFMYGVHLPDAYMPLSHVSMLEFGDPFRKHQMLCRYRKKPPAPMSSTAAPFGVFIICMLGGYICYAALNRYDNVKEDCRKMEELKKQAEAADVAKSQFLATVSHEIRTPMNGVLGMLDMLLDTELNLTQKDYAQTAQVCGKALISLINEVLDRAKIEAGKLEIESVPFDLRSILDDVISLFSAKSREKGIELAVYVSGRVPSILVGDPGRLRQIVTNLVGNSVKFTEHGHIFVQVHIVDFQDMVMDAKTGFNGQNEEVMVAPTTMAFNTLSGFPVANTRNSSGSFRMLLPNEASSPYASTNQIVSERNEDKVTLIISVEDTGIGIPVDAQDRVFTPFMQADSSTSRNYGGTGIGLSISKCLVELMGGRINFISQPHVGSTFTFTAVLRRCDNNIGGDTKRPILESLPTCFQGTRAILIDGRPVRADVTKYHMQRLGISVEDATNIDMTLNALSRQNASSETHVFGGRRSILLIEKDKLISEMDCRLADQLLKWKESGRLHEVPKTVLLSNCESDKTRAGSDVDIVIMKPLRASTMATCFQNMLGVERHQNKNTSSGSDFLRHLLAGKSILVVDDNKVNLRVAAAALKKYGAKVECVESGKDALSLLRLPHKYDACFMDVQMPEMDGFEATRRIRLMEKKANEEIDQEGLVKAEWHLPILAMTADVIQATYEECLKCGMDGYVSKPFDEAQLYQTVAKFLDSS